ncbi:toll/interleukin-1 receptor domain-containing protein [Scytonema tolypothrichoides VB-61278]|nr:toll/interleukin-1 receptor domain-containing protein [Scytonema tolypothrichoides VB-61278]
MFQPVLANEVIMTYEYDVFISHASEDKDSIVRDLAEELRKRGYRVWYDEFCLKLGDSLRCLIDKGLINSKYGIIVLSSYFFKKQWTNKELNGLTAREIEGRKVILPIWHQVSQQEISRYSSIIADKFAVDTSEGLDYVVSKIVEVLEEPVASFTGVKTPPHYLEPIASFTSVKTPPHYLLFDLLLQIDFKQQTNIVRDVIKKHRTVGLLVHNEPECGLEFLLARLLRVKPSLKNNKPIIFDVGYRNIERLWTQLGRYFHVPSNSTSEILEKICDRWQTQDVVFIFNKVDCLQPEVLSTWLKEFWEPLVTIGKENSSQKSTHLFMFLVDHGGKVHQSNIGVINSTSPLPDSRIPLCLPPVSCFPQNVLEEWISEVVMLRSDIQIELDELTSEILFQNSFQGIPQYVFEEICSFFSIDCEKVFAQCIKI